MFPDRTHTTTQRVSYILDSATFLYVELIENNYPIYIVGSIIYSYAELLLGIADRRESILSFNLSIGHSTIEISDELV